MEAIDGKENISDEHYYPFSSLGYEFSPDRARYLEKFAKFRTGIGNKYLAYGKMLRPLTFECEKAILKWHHYNCDKNFKEYNDSGELEVDAIVHAAWQYRDERIGLFFSNVTDDEHKVKINLDLENFSLAKSEFSVCLVTDAGEEELFSMKKEESKHVEIAILEKNIVLLEIS